MEKRILLTLLFTGLFSAGFSQSFHKPETGTPKTYHITAGTYLDNVDMDAVCVSEFGVDSRLADWTAVKTWIGNLPDGMNSFYAETGMPVAGICYLKWNDVRYNGSRHYFIQQFNSGAPGGFAVHDSYLSLYLGSWSGMVIQLMAEVPDITVPVNMSSFTAARTANGIQLNWTTESEQNNLGFKITRSVEGSVFETIGFINGKGTTTERQSYSYNDRLQVTCHPSPVIYRLFQVDQDGTVHSAGSTEALFANPEFELSPNYPNPFNPETTVGFSLPKKGTVILTVFDLLGRDVQKVLNREFSAGYHAVNLNAGNLASGSYFLRLEFEGKTITRQITVLR
ncbi:MAG: T9SS type A sorting domain-containing protein [Bacteroidetes bacterium]|nr:T9SS type A sorting domain-containing protein [Bacteroidota bacterium]